MTTMLRCLLTCLLLLSALPATAERRASDFPPNPPLVHVASGAAAPSARFQFDIAMDVDFEFGQGPIRARVFVNSRDGSMLLDNPHTALWAFGAQGLDKITVHHLLFQSGRAMACGEPHDERRRQDAQNLFGAERVCIELGQLFPYVIADEEQLHHHMFFEMADRRRPPRGRFDHDPRLDFIGGPTTSGELSLWMDPGRATFVTDRLFLGPGVGLAFDPRSGQVRVVRHALFEMPQHRGTTLPEVVALTLVAIERARHQVTLSGYKHVTAFTTGDRHFSDLPGGGGGIEQMNQLSAELARVMREVERMDQAGDCAGAQRAYAGMMQKMQAFQRQHGFAVPMDMEYRCKRKPRN